MSKYKIKHTSIMHNGKLCKEGSVIDFVVLMPATKPKTNTQTKTQATKTETKTQNPPENKNEGGVKDGE